MVFRSWLAFCIVIGVLQLVLGVLSVLQHNAVLSELLRQRISVVAQTTAASFKPIVDLGLPLSMIRNGDAIVARAVATDPQVRVVHAFNPSGIIVYSTDPRPPELVPREVLRSMQLSDDVKWSVETADQIYSGFNIVRRNGELTGSVVVAYPKDRLEAASNALIADIVREAVVIWTGFSAISYLVLRLVMNAPQRRLARVEAAAKGDLETSEVSTAGQALVGSFWRGLFEQEIEQLSSDLIAARSQFLKAEQVLAEFTSTESVSLEGPAGSAVEFPSGAIAANPSRSLARRVASRLTPIAAVLILASALLLAVLVLGHVNRSIEPELAARTNLIATVVSEDVQRAVAAGVPLDGLVDAETYFSEMLKQMPEIAYVAIATGRVVLEAGKRIDPYLAPPRERKDVRSHPIMHDGKEIAYVVIDVDPAFIAKKFLDVFLDMSVIVAVAVLAAYEIMVLLSSRSLTASLDRLQRLATMQAAADFSKTVVTGSRTAIDRTTVILVERAGRLNAAFAAAWSGADQSGQSRTRLSALAERFGLSPAGKASLQRFSYFTDLRLALFLYAAADEMPLSFMPLYTRAAYNPFPFLAESVLISLPLAGYLLAIVLISPFARPLGGRLGPRRLLLLAVMPTFAAHVWLHFAGSVPEIVAARVILGAGYAFVTLACQDYVIDNTPREERDRSLGMFSTVLFGGIFCGTALGGVLADRLGQANVFLLSATLVAISGMLIFTLLGDSGKRNHAVSVARPPLLASLSSARFAGLVFGIAVPGNVVLQAFICYVVALSLDSLGASPADIGRTLMVYFLAVALVGPLAGRAAERGMPTAWVAMAGALLAAAALLVAALWPSAFTIFVAVLASGIGSGMVRGAQVSLAISIAETELQHLGADPVLGALRTIERLSSIGGLLIVAAIAGLYGYGVATATVSALVAGGLVLFGLSLGLRRPPVRVGAN